MRRIAIINQKGGVGKTTTSVNLGAALAEQGRRVVAVDLDPQANLSLHLGIEPEPSKPSAYTVLHGASTFAEALHATKEANLRVLPSNIDLSGAELELASAIGRDNLLSDAIEAWEGEAQGELGGRPADYVIFDCPPSLGLLAINALAAANEVIITVQTEFLALMGMSKLVEVVTLIQKRLNPGLKITGIAPCLYDSRLRLAREVLAEIRKYFPGQVFRQPVRSNVKLAEAPSFGTSIIDYAPESNGALDYRRLALEVIAQEKGHPSLSGLPEPKDVRSLATQRTEEKAGQAPAPPPVPKAREKDPRPTKPPASSKAATPAPEAPQPGSAEAQAIEPASPPALDASSPEPAPEPPLSQVTLTPQAAPPGAEASGPDETRDPVRPQPLAAHHGDAVEEELRIMRSQDLPPLPPEAFEVDS